MEYYLPILASFLVFICMILKLGKRKANAYPCPNLPPGPWKLPIIGNLHHMIGSLPHHGLHNLSMKYGPLMHLQLGQISAVVVSNPETAKLVMKTHDLVFAQRPHVLSVDVATYGSKDIAFAPYGAYWRQLRKICITELMSAKRVKSFEYIRREETSKLVESLSSNAGSEINLSEKIFAWTYGIIARAAFGGKCKDPKAFIASVKIGGELGAGFSPGDLFPSIKALHVISGTRKKIEKFHQETDGMLESIVHAHKADREARKKDHLEVEAEDLVDVLLNLQEKGDLEFPLETDNIKAVIMDVFSAGSETSSTTLEWVMSELIKNPRVMEKAQAEVRQVFGTKGYVDEADFHELKFLKLIVKETLRLHAPVPLLLPRESKESCVINGYDIPSKTKVIVNAYTIGRDKRYWTEPERFHPERFLGSSLDYNGTNFEFIPFGAGRRICPGMLLAMANVEVPLANFLFHFDWNLPGGTTHEDFDMTEAFGMTVRRKNDLYLIPIPRRNVTVE